VGADLLDADLQLLAHTRELVGEEDIGRGRQLIEDLQAVRRREVEAQALLPAVGVLQQGVHVVGDDGQPRGGQAPHGIAPLHVLDLDDLGTPVGQQC